MSSLQPTPPTAILVFPDFRAYLDRANTILALAGILPRVHLITKQPLPDELGPLPSALSLHVPPSSARGLRFLAFALQESHRLLRALPRSEPVVLHDFFVPWIGPFLRRLTPRPELLVITSLYANNVELWRTRAWRDDDHHRCTLEDLEYLALLGRRLALEYLAHRTSNLITGNSTGLLEDFRTFFGTSPDHLRFWPSEVDAAIFRPSAEIRPIHEPLILCVGRILVRRKGLDTLLEAFSSLSSRHPSARLRLCGGADQREQTRLEHLLHDHPAADRIEVTHAKNRLELLAQYREAKVFVSFSRNEGSPRTLKEALACGLPAVVSDIAGHRAVDPDGRVLRFVALNDSRGLAEALADLLDRPDHGKRLGEAGRALMLAEYTPARIAERLVELYKEGLERKRRAGLTS